MHAGNTKRVIWANSRPHFPPSALSTQSLGAADWEGGTLGYLVERGFQTKSGSLKALSLRASCSRVSLSVWIFKKGKKIHHFPSYLTSEVFPAGILICWDSHPTMQIWEHSLHMVSVPVLYCQKVVPNLFHIHSPLSRCLYWGITCGDPKPTARYKN